MIPEDFNKAVIELTKDQTYNSSRESLNQFVLGKTIRDKGVIVINPLLFTENFDSQIRSTIYHHEYYHFLYDWQNIGYDLNTKNGQLKSFLDFYLEEFGALRHGIIATQNTFSSVSNRLEWFLNCMAEGHYENLKNRTIYHQFFKDSISKYKYHQIQLQDFLQQIFPKIRSYTLEILSFSAYTEGLKNELSFKIEDDELFSTNSRIISQILDKYQNDANELQNMDKYLKTFGISLKDMDNGIWWGVDFIKTN